MKNKIPATVILPLALCFLFAFSGCRLQQINYYGKDENYSSYTGVVNSFELLEDGTLRLTVTVDGRDYGQSFFAVKSNEEILSANGFYEEIPLNGRIEFISSAVFFADRYNYIFSIKYDEKCYLDFDTGKSNFLQYLRGN